MINSIIPGNTGGYLYVNNGYTNMPYVSPNQNNPASGMIRLNGSSLEVFDGSYWAQIGINNADISLSPDAIQTLDWAKKKMAQEQELEKLAETHECIRDLKEQADIAKHKLDMMTKLVSTKEKV